MSTRSKLLKIFLPLLIIGAGLLAARLMIVHRPAPTKTVAENPGALVQTLTVRRGAQPVRIQATGTVQPRQQVEIIPQVSGRVVELSPQLVPGGFVGRDELLLHLDDADYRLAVERAEAALAKAEYELATIAGQAKVAREEWDRLELAGKSEPSPLVLFEPQMKNARATLLSARASLRQAELDLQRTQLRAPFAAVVRSKAADRGQYLRAGTPAAVLAGTTEAEIIVPLPLHELGWLRIPRTGEKGGSAAEVELTTGGRTFTWSGRIVRSLGEVDPQSRMARVVVAVSDPYGLRAGAPGRPPLAVGSFVQVTLEGETLPDAAVLPAAALRDGAQVWVMNDRRLTFRAVEVLRRGREEVLIGKGLQAGDQVVLTQIAGAAEGMRLRPAAAEAAAQEER